jgi:hypothetical protein
LAREVERNLHWSNDFFLCLKRVLNGLPASALPPRVIATRISYTGSSAPKAPIRANLAVRFNSDLTHLYCFGNHVIPSARAARLTPSVLAATHSMKLTVAWSPADPLLVDPALFPIEDDHSPWRLCPCPMVL